jgi:DNA-binding NarL/FixJ family response regulator
MSDIASSDPAVRPVIPPGTAGSPGADIPGGDVPSVVIVDADDRTRASLVGLLGIRGRVRVLGDAAQAKAAVSLIRDCHPDVIVLDPRLPDLEGGLLAIRTIRTLDPRVRILAMGPTGNVELASAEAGADAFVRKTFRPDELADAVVRCATVQRSAPPRPEPTTGS